MTDIAVVTMPMPYFLLRQEIEKHPVLAEIIQQGQGANTPVDEVLGHAAAYCGVILDGYYDEADLLALCNVLLGKLISKRTEIIEQVVQ